MKKSSSLRKEKELALFKKYKQLIKAGYSPESPECVDLRTEILSLHIDFCLSKAHNKYKELVAKTGDVWEVANVIYLGLVRAFPNYDPDRGIQFTSFAEYDIKHMVSEFYYNDANIKPYDAELIRKYKKAQEEIIKKYGTSDRPISDYQEVSGMTAPNLLKAQAISTRADRVFVSDEAFYDMMGASDYGNPEDDAMNRAKSEVLIQGLEKLTKKQSDVILLYYGFETNKPLTFNGIAKELGITIGDAKRSLNEALILLREDPEIRQYFQIGQNKKNNIETADDYDYSVML